ncbi:MAG: hypothetical protein ACRC5C_11550 [Bacilli bacterium]
MPFVFGFILLVVVGVGLYRFRRPNDNRQRGRIGVTAIYFVVVSILTVLQAYQVIQIANFADDTGSSPVTILGEWGNLGSWVLVLGLFVLSVQAFFRIVSELRQA